MKVLILGASGFLGGILYRKIKKETDFWVLGTYCQSKSDNDLIKLNVTNFIEVRTFLEHFEADVVVWCIKGKTNEKELIAEGFPNILNNTNSACKFIFISTNEKTDGEKLVKERDDYIIIKPGNIYGQDTNVEVNVEVNELSDEILNLIKAGYKGVIHLGPEKR